MPKAPRKRGTTIEVGNAMGGGAAKIKKKIRDISRLLRRPNLSAEVKLENERALKALEIELEEAQGRNKEKKNAKRYHMVKFFEKKKAVRKLRQAQKTVDELTKEAEDDASKKKEAKKARKVLKHCQIDVAYIILYPKADKYISLYVESSEPAKTPKAKKGAQESEQAKRERRKQMEALIDSGELPFTFEDVLDGKTIEAETEKMGDVGKEIDAPEEAGEQEDDDFFE